MTSASEGGAHGVPPIEPKGAAANLTADQLMEIYRHMVTGRRLETRLHNLYRGGRLTGAVYPGVGQEASMVGFAYALADGDIWGGTHRDLQMQLTRGVTLEETMLNFYGKKDAPTKGRDGNSHFGVLDKGTLMVVSPLPDAWPVAVGAALTFAQRQEPRVALANCGEGATATGTWHEAVNYAAVLELPIVFTVQNNQFAYSTPNEREFHTPEGVAGRAKGYGIPGIRVDGNDVFATYAAAAEAVERARNGGGPTLIEAITFRHYGHAGHDPADYVPPDVREYWLARDPIPRFEAFLMREGLLDDERKAAIEQEVDEAIRRAMDWAQQQADPDPDDEERDMFAVWTEPAVNPLPPSEETAEVVLLEAITMAIDQSMEADERVFVQGEDVGVFGGAFKVTKGLFDKYGPTRVIDTPIAEIAILGSSVGAALMGQRPIAELQFMDFVYPALDQLVNEAAKYHWKGGGKAVPIVVRGPTGAGVRSGPFHSISPESLLSHHPGIKVVYPSTPYNAKGLFLAALRDPNPVLFLEHKKLYRDTSLRSEIPVGDYTVEIGKGRVAREGSDLTIVAWGAMTHTSLAAAEKVAGSGISVEVLDMQSVFPFDFELVLSSVTKTSRLLIVQEDTPFASVASEVAAVVADEAFWDLDAPIRRVTSKNTYVPFAPVLEDAFLPQVDDVVAAIEELAGI